MASNQPQEARAQQNFLNDEANGVTAYSLDPDATQEQNASTAGKARDQLKDIMSKDLDPVKGLSPKYSDPTIP